MTAEGIKGRLQQQLQTSSKKDGRGGSRREGAEEELWRHEKDGEEEKEERLLGRWRGRSSATNETEGKRKKKKKRWTQHQGNSKDVGVQRKTSKRNSTIVSKADSIWIRLSMTTLDGVSTGWCLQDGLIV